LVAIRDGWLFVHLTGRELLVRRNERLGHAIDEVRTSRFGLDLGDFYASKGVGSRKMRAIFEGDHKRCPRSL
jgi:hypothetical protein